MYIYCLCFILRKLDAVILDYEDSHKANRLCDSFQIFWCVSNKSEWYL